MPIAIIQLPPDSSGKMIAARSYTENANTVYAQAGYLTTDTALGNPAGVTNATPSITDWGLVVRHADGVKISGTDGVNTQNASVKTFNGYNLMYVRDPEVIRLLSNVIAELHTLNDSLRDTR